MFRSKQGKMGQTWFFEKVYYVFFVKTYFSLHLNEFIEAWGFMNYRWEKKSQKEKINKDRTGAKMRE